MWNWSRDEMMRCRNMLMDSGEEKRNLSLDFLNECTEEVLSADDRILLQSLAETLLTSSKFEELLAESILRIDKIYSIYEERITDYFDLNAQRPPKTELGVSTFEKLKEHESQMPFKR